MLILTTLFIGMFQIAAQPPVHPADNEPNWEVVLSRQFDLDMGRDLRNPADGTAPAGLFIQADKKKPVTFTPLIALGLESPVHAGWYPAGPKASDLPTDVAKARIELWSYAFKQPKSEMESGSFTPPPLKSGEVTFDPGGRPFGLWVSNEAFTDGGVFTQPALVARMNERLRAQPYKAMIYPTYDPKKKQAVPNSYIIGWEYSTNDDFQDAVTRIDNVRLLPAEPALPGVLKPGDAVKKLAGGFAFVEGPAWDFRNKVLYFSDIPRSQICSYGAGKAGAKYEYAGQTNGLMFDREGLLIGCEHGGRRVSHDVLGKAPRPLALTYRGKKLNSPNDLAIDASGGIYFTDPRYGDRSNMELDQEGVYYIAADAKDTEPKRLISDLVRPNGIALSPSGDYLYVVDNGAERIHRYKVTGNGSIDAGALIAHVPGPDGMTVDREGRLYITSVDGVSILDANGKWIGAIEVPEQPANCTFGGDDWSTLFITARTSLYAIPTQTRGWHIHLEGAPKK